MYCLSECNNQYAITNENGVVIAYFMDRGLAERVVLFLNLQIQL